LFLHLVSSRCLEPTGRWSGGVRSRMIQQELRVQVVGDNIVVARIGDKLTSTSSPDTLAPTRSR
jgi:hypothetical protein